ncbi:MAG TPA: hypothetical protein VFE86_19065 [Ilumatobacteraceae bacterium]|jgi:hypothetical protein|nr:hypothetical protein [Ilumatobacteraceae bacterium]
MDVAHCGINLLYDGFDTAEAFTREREQHSGRNLNGWADIATIIGLLDPHRRNPPAHRQRYDIEVMLTTAVNDIDSA